MEGMAALMQRRREARKRAEAEGSDVFGRTRLWEQRGQSERAGP